MTDANFHAAMMRLANIATETNRNLETVTRVLKQMESRIKNIERIQRQHELFLGTFALTYSDLVDINEAEFQKILRVALSNAAMRVMTANTEVENGNDDVNNTG